RMTHLILQCKPTPTTGPCGVCGRMTEAGAGPRLVHAESQRPVCGDCGGRHAPSPAALVQLAGAAEPPGRLGRPPVFPPYTALLELARAADDYTAAVPAPRRECA